MQIPTQYKDVSDGEQTPTLYDYPVRDITDIDRYLSRLLIIIEKGDFDATVCGAAFIARTVMRMVAEHHSIDFEIQSPTELALTFFACGFLTQSDYQIMVRSIEISDRVIEEHEKVSAEANLARQAVEMVQRLYSFHSQGMEGHHLER